mmetsp:Transcript_37259/g.64025  ORF Transcript_37259/g.64025 Transcript_37259/m.64025 type:complete len:750 (-) Transcript_37259:39-2288(-)
MRLTGESPKQFDKKQTHLNVDVIERKDRSPTIKWRRLSADDNLPSPRNYSNQEYVLKKKLSKEESLLGQEFETLLSMPKNCKRRQSLKRRIEIRTDLVNAMKGTLDVQQNVVLNSGYIQVKIVNDENFSKRYCIIAYPVIKVYHSDKEFFPIHCIELESAINIITDDFGFTVQREKNRIQFMTDSKEECNQWAKAISFAAGIPINPEAAPKRPRRRSLIISSTDMARQVEHLPKYTPSDCDNFEMIQTSFSDKVQIESKNGKYFLKAGTLEDIVKWCIIFCTSNRSKPSISCILCKHWICTPDDFKSTILTIWKNWEAKGFPIGFPRDILSERLLNFVVQYLDSPMMGIQSWNTDESKKLILAETDARVSCRKETIKFHKFFGQSLKLIGVQHNPNRDEISDTKCKFAVAERLDSKTFDNAISYSVKEIVSQITLIEAKLFMEIPLDEFMDKNWENIQKSPHLANFHTFSNKIFSWVIDTILSGKDTKEQISRYTKFIKIAEQLNYMHNFNSCVSVLGGIESASVSRLKQLKNIPDNIQVKLKNLLEKYSPLNGYKNYRSFSKLKKCIPLVGVYLRDLTLSLDGNVKFIDDEKTIINFDRMKLVADSIVELKDIDVSQYLEELVLVPSLKDKIDKIKIIETDDLYKKSLQIQPLVDARPPEEKLEELEKQFEGYKAETQSEIENLYLNQKKQQMQIEKLRCQLQNVDKVFSTYQTKKAPKASSKTKKELSHIKIQLLNAMLLCDELLLE